MVPKPEHLSEMFGAIARPTAALSLEAAIEGHLKYSSTTPLPGRTGASFVPDLVEPLHLPYPQLAIR